MEKENHVQSKFHNQMRTRSKQSGEENGSAEPEKLEMDANNNSPKVVSSNLLVPTIIVQPSTPSTPLPSTPKRKILPPGTFLYMFSYLDSLE